jgi:hypothetical protein
MMGQQQETVAGSTALRRMVLVLLAAAVMAVMVAAMAMPASAGLAKGQTNENRGATQNDYVGDVRNDVANPQCNPDTAHNFHGGGCANN